jgi:hypothetical protein
VFQPPDLFTRRLNELFDIMNGGFIDRFDNQLGIMEMGKLVSMRLRCTACDARDGFCWAGPYRSPKS